MLVEKVLLQIKDDPSLKWLKPLTSLLHRRDQKKYCRFHKDHDHTTEECRYLEGKTEELIHKGKLRKFLKKDHHHHWVEEKPKQADVRKDEEQENTRATVGEIRMITRKPVTGGSFKSL